MTTRTYRFGHRVGRRIGDLLVRWLGRECPHGVSREPGYWCADCEGQEPF